MRLAEYGCYVFHADYAALAERLGAAKKVVEAAEQWRDKSIRATAEGVAATVSLNNAVDTLRRARAALSAKGGA